ncbi:MAG: 16S rRNA (cytosine(1402)-N(4))-methyltransferase RsmH [Propionibacteriaceae bacterium]|jgi:16S rRNA (cytosine1402-N4)-methyltransferase|nr:16S rRNA (cytosine(1402)-N(4))-methyltransferase RsmH [Propionibacteriaceae bacterium]
MMQTYTHIPVMCEEILTLLAPALSAPGSVMVDATLGLGGHSLAALNRYPDLTLIGIDRDPQAIDAAQVALADHRDRMEIHHTTFDHLEDVVDGRTVDTVLFDLGLSSLQIDSIERGFSYAQDSPLDMRMDGDTSQLSAADVVNTYSATQLESIFRHYGDESHARRIARAIVAQREIQPFETSQQLVETVTEAIPRSAKRIGHRAKRVFQAVRMEVNSERNLLTSGLPQGLGVLNPGGFLAVLSYHSGEDRLVKKVFAEACSDQVPLGLPVIPEAHQARFSPVTRGAQSASEQEIASNPRASSARLRVIRRKEVLS